MNRLKSIIQKFGFAIYPLLLCLFPLLSFYGSNYAEIKAGSFSLTTFVVFNLIVGVLAWAVSFAATRNVQKASLLSALILVVFFTFGRAHDVLHDTAIETPFMTLGPTRLLLIASVLLFVAVWFVIRKLSIEKVAKTGQTLTLVAGAMVISTLFTIGVAMASSGKQTAAKPASVQNQTVMQNSEAQPADAEKPDVYYILLDGYTRQDYLKTYSSYDNAPFINGLRDRGFYVADKANSNYAHTHWSVPSTFNMKYLNYLVDEMGSESSDRTPLREMTLNHQVGNEFKSLGYKFVNIGSQWQWTTKTKQGDIEIPMTSSQESKIVNIGLNEFTLVYMQTTALKPFISTNIRDTLVSRMLGAFERTEKVPEIKEPTFTFTHVVSPHPPYLFDKNGIIPSQTPLELDNEGFSDREKFTDQTTFVNKRVTEMIDKILKTSEKPPIIILASDHGSAAGLTVGDFVDIDPNNLKKDGVKERQGILNAYFFPDKNYEKLYPYITPVNTFRLVFSQYFNKDYQLLPDRSYFSGNKGNNEYKLYDVTDLVNSDAKAFVDEE